MTAHREHKVDGEEEDRCRVVNSERDQVDDPEERVWHHRLENERGCSGVGLRDLATKRLLHASRDPKDTPADEHRAYEVEQDDY